LQAKGKRISKFISSDWELTGLDSLDWIQTLK